MSVTKKTKAVAVKTAVKPEKETAKRQKTGAKAVKAAKVQSAPNPTKEKEESEVEEKVAPVKKTGVRGKKTSEKQPENAAKVKSASAKKAVTAEPQKAVKAAKTAKVVDVAKNAKPAEKKVTKGVKVTEKVVATKAVKPVKKEVVEAKSPAKKTNVVKPVEKKVAPVAKKAAEVKSAKKTDAVKAIKPTEKKAVDTVKPTEVKPAKKAKAIEVVKPAEVKPAKKAKAIEAVKPAEVKSTKKVKAVETVKPVEAKVAKKVKIVDVVKPVEVKAEKKAEAVETGKKAKKSKADETVKSEKKKVVETVNPVETKPAKKVKASKVTDKNPAEKPIETESKNQAKLSVSAKKKEIEPLEEKVTKKGVSKKAKKVKVEDTVSEVSPKDQGTKVKEDASKSSAVLGDENEEDVDAVAEMAALGDQQEYDLTNVIPEEKPSTDRKNARVVERHGISTKNDTMKTYMHEIGQIGLIKKEDEVKLAEQIHSKDPVVHDNARDKLILSNLRLVVKIAHDFKGLGLPLLDLISEGNIGLMRAVEKFDPAKGAKFSSYAAWWIKQSMRRALANQGRIIRVPVQSAGKITKIKSVRIQLTEKLGREPTKAEIAKKLEYSERTVNSLLLAELKTISLHDPIQQGEDGEFQDIIPDKNAMTPDRILGDEESVKRLMTVLNSLEERERVILTMRFGLGGQKAPMTLEEVSQSIGRTRERVRQIQNQALAKLRMLLADEISFAKE